MVQMIFSFKKTEIFRFQHVQGCDLNKPGNNFPPYELHKPRNILESFNFNNNNSNNHNNSNTAPNPNMSSFSIQIICANPLGSQVRP